MPSPPRISWFSDLRIADVALVGGKTASLGELYAAFPPGTVKVPNGFAITAAAYREAVNTAGAWDRLHDLLDDLDKNDVAELARRGAAARQLIYDVTSSEFLRRDIITAYRKLEQEYGKKIAVAVRSSATAEDLPNASFAGQHESYLHVRGDDDVVDACRKCFASLFTDRAISYRIDNGFDHFKVFLSVAVMKMVRSDLAASGVIFTLDTETGFRNVVFITGSYGLGENIVKGMVDPDEFYVHKTLLAEGHRTVLSRKLGTKKLRMVYGRGHGEAATRNVVPKRAECEKFCLNDAEVLALADSAVAIEAHYSAKAGHPQPMDIEWAKDAEDGALYIVQARPETVASQHAVNKNTVFSLTGSGPLLASGRAVGERIATGRVRLIRHAAELSSFRPGEVLVADTTTPDWEPVMKNAAAIVTNRGGRTCHAAIVARELGLAAVVGTGNGTTTLIDGMEVTVSCAEGSVGKIYQGKIPFSVAETDTGNLGTPRTTQVMINLGNPEMAFSAALLPSAGVGLARMEFIIQEYIGIHPMALCHPEKIILPRTRTKIARMTRGYDDGRRYFIDRLAEGIARIAGAFYPRPVILRLSDFKTNEYAGLIGGTGFEPVEANPMIGFRGASRYAHPAYEAGFALECAAIRQVRQGMGLTNLHIMIPFCRRLEEARRTIEILSRNGLERDENGLEIYMMCEIPNNVILIDEFAEIFSGFSIGSNDLTQLTLGVDRDSGIVAFDFDERDPGMLKMFSLAIAGAKRHGRHIGICGEAPANDPEIARYLVREGIDSISVTPASVIKTLGLVLEAEK
jgi:pyruvate,water dikinase